MLSKSGISNSLFKVHGLGPNWRNTQRSVRYQKSNMDVDDNTSQDDTISDENESNPDDTFGTKTQNEDFLCNYNLLNSTFQRR